MNDDNTTTTTPNATPSSCRHQSFDAKVSVTNDGPAALTAMLQVWCKECGLPMRFPDAGRHTAATLRMEA